MAHLFIRNGAWPRTWYDKVLLVIGWAVVYSVVLGSLGYLLWHEIR